MLAAEHLRDRLFAYIFCNKSVSDGLHGYVHCSFLRTICIWRYGPLEYCGPVLSLQKFLKFYRQWFYHHQSPPRFLTVIMLPFVRLKIYKQGSACLLAGFFYQLKSVQYLYSLPLIWWIYNCCKVMLMRALWIPISSRFSPFERLNRKTGCV